MMVVGHNFAEKLAELLDARFVDLEKRTFPDGEVCPRVLTDNVEKHVIVAERMIAAQYHNRYLVETILSIKNLRFMGAEKIDVVMPYFVYSRQDETFRKGEPFSAKFVLEMLADAGATRFFTVSSHSDRDKEMVSFSPIPAYNINGFVVIGDYMKGMDFVKPLVIGPDEGAVGFVKTVSQKLGCEGTTFYKERNLDTGDITMCSDADCSGRDVIIVDDIVSSGSTLLNSIKLCKKSGARRIYCAVVHVISTQCIENISHGVDKFIACNTIHSPISTIPVEKLVAQKIREVTDKD